MDPKSPIVCATDLSPGGARAVDLAARVAQDLRAPLRLVHATDLGGLRDRAASPAQRTLIERVEQRTAFLAEQLESERTRASATAPEVECALIEGRPWEAIVEDAHRTHAQLVVVGPHGQSGPAEVLRSAAMEWLLGITADRVVRRAPCPVLVAPHTGELPRLASGTFLVGLDFEPPSRVALDLALQLAKQLGARVHAVHVVPEILPAAVAAQHAAPIADDTIDHPAHEEAGARDRLAEMITEARARLDAAPPVDLHVVRGDPPVALGELALELGATLIVVGTHGRTGVAHALLGSVAERVLRRARRPVLCVRPAR
ncbi:universal stress protein [Sandaracinus amylolyticus]|uniref:Universal stress protein family n=1 Tax=Sandaracinus amylolyticus TaxID=927083 RepID=A0A0F6YK59_9BACT|nr:universal stress protein [Sandaracinus amylolyticus]AKF08507.1 Universal stress protein family [Sandaracinus amylolyticus]